MDSQVALIDSHGNLTELAAPDPAFGAITILDFDRDVMISTNATVRGQSHIRYSVKTVRAGLAGMNPKTVFSQGERILATAQRRDMIPDLLTLGGETMTLGSWLKTPMFSSFPVSFSEGGVTYLWKESQDGGIDLYKGSGASTSTIARFYSSDFVVTHDRRIITVFISCVLIVQKARRNAKAKERDSASQALMISSMAVPGGGF